MPAHRNFCWKICIPCTKHVHGWKASVQHAHSMHIWSRTRRPSAFQSTASLKQIRPYLGMSPLKIKVRVQGKDSGLPRFPEGGRRIVNAVADEHSWRKWKTRSFEWPYIFCHKSDKLSVVDMHSFYGYSSPSSRPRDNQNDPEAVISGWSYNSRAANCLDVLPQSK